MSLIVPTQVQDIAALVRRKITPVSGDPEDNILATSYLGNPVYSNLIFDANSSTPENEDLIINTVIMTVSQSKNIVKTQLSGRDGTVKEYINMGDYVVDIRGLLVSQFPKVKPRNEHTALKNLCEVNESLSVSSEFLRIFEITDIVVESYSFAELEGFHNQIGFTINAVSDVPIDIQLET